MGENGESVGWGYLFWSGGVPAKSRERRMPAFAKSAMVSCGRSKVKIPTCRTKRDKGGAPAFSSLLLRNGVNRKSNQLAGHPTLLNEGALRLLAGRRGGRANTGRLVRCAA